MENVLESRETKEFKAPRSWIDYAPELDAADAEQLSRYLSDIGQVFRNVQSVDFLEAAPLLAQELPFRLREYIHKVRLKQRPAVFVIPALNVIGRTGILTPKDWKDVQSPSPTHHAEIFLTLVASLLGDVFGWTTQQDGRYVHDVLPMKGLENEQVGWSSLTQLSWHTEDAFHPNRADYLALLCLRNIDGVATTLCSVTDLDLPVDVKEILWQERFYIRPDQSHTAKHNSTARGLFEKIEQMNRDPEPVSLLFGNPNHPYIRIDPDYMMAIPGDAEAERALSVVVDQINRNLYDLALREGDLVVIDNLQVVHGRRAFKARFDGYDRWLKRVNIKRDLRQAAAALDQGGRLMTTISKTSEQKSIVAREADLVEAVQPIRGLALATSVQHFFSKGIYDLLASSQGRRWSLEELAKELKFDADRLRGLLRFLRNEGFIEGLDGKLNLTEKAHRWSVYRAWYEMMVGGYAETFVSMGDALAEGTPPAPRDGKLVGKGSCGISMHDSIPIVRRLLSTLDEPPKLVVDLGCGSGSYLTEICKLYKDTKAIGIEPDLGGCLAAQEHIAECGMSDRIEIVHADAIDYIQKMETPPDLILLCFVIHEVLGQSGEERVMQMLQAAMNGGPNQRLVIIDIDYLIDDPSVMSHKLAEGYYNAYFLLHPFTSQKLETQSYWDDLFARCGFEIEAKQTTDPSLDSTNIELGWMLRRKK
ncbi:amino acid hydroxylase [Leptospira perolatii]|uniref:Amino acid hydroxylase n=1 Tax=Leptospira perolatii TaxID=2023191 RepID=A0A2M9ZQT0_9LEPT|nr:guanitoxin biosynthesis L-enduracididine beta-hydroxylase GntD [Leptospira perolatii]PJZ70483.1 amino acid hydroxylase [Leptospira perolatii]PJZ74319.1 amino acid hydroxylase [Leptospira perolatii]